MTTNLAAVIGEKSERLGKCVFHMVRDDDMAAILSAARIAQELTALLHELYPYNGAPSPVAQLKEVIAQSLGYSEAFDRGRALERETTESLRAALAEKEAESARLRERVDELTADLKQSEKNKTYWETRWRNETGSDER